MIRWACAMGCGLGACGAPSPGETDPPADDRCGGAPSPAWAWAADADEALEVGTGEDTFVPLAAGGVLDLVPGPQGLQHVFVSVRAPLPVDPTLPRGTVETALWAPCGEVSVQPIDRLGVALADRDGRAEAVGVRIVVDPVEPVIDQRVVLTAGLSLVGEGRRARGAVEVEVRWAGTPPPEPP